ncbi:MFS transporter [Celerinatantimonas yamalensis]|uniref:MFS transporter n=1 Tax=Celerinatantimonas yamalensis TaxID=559956 RepID=A0ABW9G540_9GAMM
MPHLQPDNHPSLTSTLVLLMAVTTGVAVASNYYAQPLLDTLADYFHISQSMAGNVVTIAQLSYGTGLLLAVPIADIVERRALMINLLALTCVGLMISAFSPNIYWLFVGTAMTGFCSVVAQVLVPFAATLAAPQNRGHIVGRVMAGLLLGILMARVFAGGLSTFVNWRWVYGLAALILAGITIALAQILPHAPSTQHIRYRQLIGSVLKLFQQQPILVYRSLLGMMSFCLFSMFWTPLAFLLAKPPYQYSDAIIGLFGLVGAAGVMAATWAGKLADAGHGRQATFAGLVGLIISWGLLYFSPHSLTLLLVGVVLLDLTSQLVHVSNQNVIYSLDESIRNRLNAGYMTCYFIGGAFGSWLSVTLYQIGGWSWVSLAGLSIASLALLVALYKHQ